MPYYLMLSLAAIFWGGNYVVGRVLVAGIDPFLLSAIRWTLTALLLGLIYWRRMARECPRVLSDWGRLVGFASLGQVAFPVTLYMALQTVTSVRTAIYMAASPCIVMLLSRVFFGDPLSRRALLGILVSTLGVLVILSEGQLSRLRDMGGLSAGDLWAMGSVLSWAVYCSGLRLKPKGLSSETFVALSSMIGAVLLIPFAWSAIEAVQQGEVVLSWNVTRVLGVAYLVIFPSWLAYLFWNRGIAVVGAARGDIFTHLIPLSGGLLGILLLGEPFGTYHLVGACCILTGLFLCRRPPSGS
ncbi:MAG: EamA family transporter [Lautropia sp.]|nr:EamA family transporter [Lautropia sp.]